MLKHLAVLALFLVFSSETFAKTRMTLVQYRGQGFQSISFVCLKKVSTQKTCHYHILERDKLSDEGLHPLRFYKFLGEFAKTLDYYSADVYDVLPVSSKWLDYFANGGIGGVGMWFFLGPAPVGFAADMLALPFNGIRTIARERKRMQVIRAIISHLEGRNIGAVKLRTKKLYSYYSRLIHNAFNRTLAKRP